MKYVECVQCIEYLSYGHLVEKNLNFKNRYTVRNISNICAMSAPMKSTTGSEIMIIERYKL